ncbi:MAG: bifunctional class I SAM-dependent methyltransferase/glycosyltransferase family 2 protein [Acidobacteriota bacterium]
MTRPDASSTRQPPAPDSAGANRSLAARFDALAADRDRWKARNAYYHRSIEALCRRFIPPGSRVLELGSGTGDLLAALSPDPRESLGIDISPRTVEHARAKYPALRFAVGDAQELDLPAGAAYDFIVASDLVGHLDDVYATFRGLRAACHGRTRLVVTYYNFLWEGVLQLAERAGGKMPQGHQNWLGMQDLENLLFLGNFRVAARGWELLLPKRVPLVSELVNAVAPRVPGLRHLCLVQYAVADIAPGSPHEVEAPSVSVIVPCRNEEGNVDEAVARIPDMGRHTEIVFVDGQSTDGTVARIEMAMSRLRGIRDIRLIHQVPPEANASREDPDRMLQLGKGDAVRKGFAAASGDVVMILDADLTVAPEDLPRFVEVLSEGKARFVNGSRLVYPMEDESMRFLNLCGNKAFSLAFTWLLGQPLKDTLCGTKVLFRSDYERIAADRAYFGDFDPFGDFDLLFGAARQRLPMVDMPVRYSRRTAGVSKVRLVSHGWLLVRMSWIAFLKFKWNRWLGRDRPVGADR